MGDPFSIAGVTIAVFDQVLKLGERTIELTSDIRCFSNDMKRIHETVRDEDMRTRALKCLLFDSCSEYDGRFLFEQFDDDLQEQIQSYLGQLHGTLFNAYQLLASRYGSTSSNLGPDPGIDQSRTSSRISLASTVNDHPVTGSMPPLKRSSRSPLLMLRWSFYDKKQAEKTVRDFCDLNRRIESHIQLFCLGSRLGLDRRHLSRLTTDQNSKKLGFDVDATLRLASIDESSGLEQSLVLTDPSWVEALQRSNCKAGGYSVVNCGGTPVLVESRSYTPMHQTPGDVDFRTKSRVEAFARLLHQPKEQIFRIPRCNGWSYIARQQQICFLFEIPDGVKPQPVSLLELLGNLQMRVSLGNKFLLAHGLAQCMSQLHMVQWVHESFRSGNILFYPPVDETGRLPLLKQVADVDFYQPWVLGFQYSRQEPDFSVGFNDMEPSHDIYKHPERQGLPQKTFNKSHDIYALGVVLLEIGLWEPAITLEKNKFVFAKDPKNIKARLVQQAERRLESKVGRKYRDLVLRCLNGDFDVHNDSKGDLKLQQEFRREVVDVLERAAQNV